MALGSSAGRAWAVAAPPGRSCFICCGLRYGIRRTVGASGTRDYYQHTKRAKESHRTTEPKRGHRVP
jgi:hypothetical protein